MRTRRVRATITIAISLSVLAACSGDDTAEPAESAAAPSDAADEPSTEAGDDPVSEASGTDSGGDTDPVTDETDREQPSTDEPPPPPDAEDGDNVATVTIGDDTYEIDVTPSATQRCDSNFFGAFWALGGDADTGIELLLPPPEDPNFDEPASVMVTVTVDGTETQWVADPSLDIAGVDDGESQVDDFTVNGNSVGGVATFIDRGASYAFQGGTGDEPEPVQGSFAVTCSG